MNQRCCTEVILLGSPGLRFHFPKRSSWILNSHPLFTLTHLIWTQEAKITLLLVMLSLLIYLSYLPGRINPRAGNRSTISVISTNTESRFSSSISHSSLLLLFLCLYWYIQKKWYTIINIAGYILSLCPLTSLLSVHPDTHPFISCSSSLTLISPVQPHSCNECHHLTSNRLSEHFHIFILKLFSYTFAVFCSWFKLSVSHMINATFPCVCACFEIW